jgi:hypothetical protein
LLNQRQLIGRSNRPCAGGQSAVNGERHQSRSKAGTQGMCGGVPAGADKQGSGHLKREDRANGRKTECVCGVRVHW